MWRARLNAATMLGQSSGGWNRMEQRPLEGFLYAITPFNFTAIAGNLPTAPALMGNVALWKPASTQSLGAHLIMRLLEEAGLPAGVINMLPGHGKAVSEVALAHRDLAGIHFTGSTATLPTTVEHRRANIAHDRSYPPWSGSPATKVSVWYRLREELIAQTEALNVGDVTDLRNFAGAVIDRRAFDRYTHVLQRAAVDPELQMVAADSTSGLDVKFAALDQPSLDQGNLRPGDQRRIPHQG